MAKRLLDCSSSELLSFSKKELLESIRKCEGRVMVSETIGSIAPMLGDVTNAEFAASMGADILILNMFDTIEPKIQGLPDCEKSETVRLLKKLTGRPIAINLEPVLPDAEMETGDLWKMTKGRLATLENGKRARDLGVNMIVLTGNPGVGVTNEAISETLKIYRKELGEDLILMAGKMHASGILTEAAESILTEEDIRQFAQAGADIILMPAPGSVPGITQEYVKKLVNLSHSLGVLTMTAIGTSQEGADRDTVRQLALMSKMTGTDMHHLGDAGYAGMALPENIMTYSIAIRGIRHTYHRMAASINR